MAALLLPYASLASPARAALASAFLLACSSPRFDGDASIDGGRATDPNGPDAAHLDARTPDAGNDATIEDGRFVRASALCDSDAGSQLPGDECVAFVTCGNAGKCDLGALTCCMGFGGLDDCGAFVGCDERDIARCDGPEDCSLGTICCFEGGSTSCEESCAPGNELCHGDEDCTRGECATGRYDLGVQFWIYWGFCEL